MESEIVLAGFGGQGVLTAGLIIAELAMKKGKQVTWLPAYGAEMRGGKSYSVVKFSPYLIANPDVEEISVLIALNKQALEFAQFMRFDGLIIYNSDRILPEEIPNTSNDLVGLQFDTLSTLLANPKAINIMAIGALIKKTHLFSPDDTIEAVQSFFTVRGKGKYVSANTEAFWSGYNSIES